jgi:predicted TIM-barrel fold metal-dependent hydrolase
VTEKKLWANSGDSHYMEPPDMFDSLPDELKERLPKSVKDEARGVETITVDGQTFERAIPKPVDPEKMMRNMAVPLEEDRDGQPVETMMDVLGRAPGAFDPVKRLDDQDEEGVWAEAIYPSLGTWAFNIQTPEIAKIGAQVSNDFFLKFQNISPERFVVAATIPLLDIDDTVAEIHRCADMGFKLGFFPVKPTLTRPDWHYDEWHPVWAALEEVGMVLGFHIGTEPWDPTQRQGVYYRGPGGAVLNYVETTYGGQRAVTQMIASGALDRHPDLKILVSEGGATWGPFMADRMDEGYRQHGAAVRPRLSKPPSEYLYEQVYASFQHDASAVLASSAMGWKNVMWGSDYPHWEGTYGHTQKTLHELFDDVDEDTSHRVRIGAFQELFPHTSLPPES